MWQIQILPPLNLLHYDMELALFKIHLSFFILNGICSVLLITLYKYIYHVLSKKENA